MRTSELNAWWRAGVVVTRPLVRVLFRVHVEGIEHVPSEGPAILAFNHVSVLDGPCLAIETASRRRRETRFLVAAEIFRISFLGWVLRRYLQIPIRRGAADSGALDEAVRTIAAGALAGIAPEGRINDRPGELQRIRSGLARLALPTRAPVVPVGIWGTQVRWPRGKLLLRSPLRPRLALVFGEPVLPAGDVDRPPDIEAFSTAVREALERQLLRAREIADRDRPGEA